MAKLYVEPMFKESAVPKPPSVELHTSKSYPKYDDPPEEVLEKDLYSKRSISLESFVNHLSDDEKKRLKPTLERLLNAVEQSNWVKALKITYQLEELLELSLK